VRVGAQGRAWRLMRRPGRSRRRSRCRDWMGSGCRAGRSTSHGPLQAAWCWSSSRQRQQSQAPAEHLMGGRPGPACTPRGNAASPPAWLTARAGPRQRPSSPPPLQAASPQQGSYPSYTYLPSLPVTRVRTWTPSISIARPGARAVPCLPIVQGTLPSSAFVGIVGWASIASVGSTGLAPLPDSAEPPVLF